MPEGRGSLVEDLRTIRRNLQQAIEGAAYLSRKFHGPRPKDANDAKLAASDNIAVLVGDIRRHSETLIQILDEHHEFVGNLEEESGIAGRAEIGTQARY